MAKQLGGAHQSAVKKDNITSATCLAESTGATIL